MMALSDFWKAKITNDNGKIASRVLSSVVIKSVGERFVVRFNFADGAFGDIEHRRMPRFDLGEEFTVALQETVEMRQEKS